MTTHTNEWLTVAEACQYLRITRATLYRWANRGVIRLHRFGPRTTRVRAKDLERLVSEPVDGEWATLSQEAFDRDWDNSDDAVYDNWRELYGVRDG